MPENILRIENSLARFIFLRPNCSFQALNISRTTAKREMMTPNHRQ
jgi:hypothetical protein